MNKKVRSLQLRLRAIENLANSLVSIASSTYLPKWTEVIDNKIIQPYADIHNLPVTSPSELNTSKVNDIAIQQVVSQGGILPPLTPQQSAAELMLLQPPNTITFNEQIGQQR